MKSLKADEAIEEVVILPYFQAFFAQVDGPHTPRMVT